MPRAPRTRLSLEIFWFLVENFVDHLKHELGVFFETIFFRFLQSSNANFSQKRMVLMTLHRCWCASPRRPAAVSPPPRRPTHAAHVYPYSLYTCRSYS